MGKGGKGGGGIKIVRQEQEKNLEGEFERTVIKLIAETTTPRIEGSDKTFVKQERKIL